MAISITASDVKRKAGIDSASTTYDAAVTSLISEMQGPLEYSIADQYITDASNSGLQATLKLGIVEMIAGEFVEQLRREIGSTEQFTIAGLSVGPSAATGVELIQQGATRLAPYLKSALPMMSETACSSSTADAEMAFSELASPSKGILSSSKEVW